MLTYVGERYETVSIGMITTCLWVMANLNCTDCSRLTNLQKSTQTETGQIRWISDNFIKPKSSSYSAKKEQRNSRWRRLDVTTRSVLNEKIYLENSVEHQKI